MRMPMNHAYAHNTPHPPYHRMPITRHTLPITVAGVCAGGWVRSSDTICVSALLGGACKCTTDSGACAIHSNVSSCTMHRLELSRLSLNHIGYSLSNHIRIPRRMIITLTPARSQRRSVVVRVWDIYLWFCTPVFDITIKFS